VVLQPPQARVRSGSQSFEASSRTLADNKNNCVEDSKLRIIKDR
jgi:hypothetical protein